MGDVLRADLDALGRLRPQIEELVTQFKADIPSPAAATPGMDPEFAVFHTLASETLPDVGKVFAGWMSAVGEVCAAFQRGLVLNEEHGIAVMRAIPGVSLHPVAHI
ncbi:hypothetical protein P5V93_15260 [Mycobacteroides abscessus subsp. abscessus]|uniref:hypothetical protein n=1 Tax=Mycobacteroides abscessus TaxID=36809 RepID=UPI00092CC758|nr:hypothetical protein [Mycobacteroides abscessus]AWG47986.1 hypothetical protein DDT48_00195 [Mycobacteroides abscessus]MBN7551582.1 hypothetical protein [Mycobacteroides abscessus subsp. abscessus]MDM2172355.1 hypothetical protein [Mycobacteroides abscessus]MDM2178991.1 hypothetical protein [Mycobacteroides abscessus]MDM2208506.1 hypothetical protein [Mycobacteroides abscessus]